MMPNTNIPSSSTVQINVNLEPVLRRVYNFQTALGNKLSKAALREGGKYLLSKVREAEPKRSGKLRKATVLKNSRLQTPRRTGNVGMFIGVARRSAQRDAYYGFFVNNGTRFQTAQRFFENERTAQIVITALESGARQLANNIP